MRITVEIPDGYSCFNCVFLCRHFGQAVCRYHRPELGIYTSLEDVYNDNTGLAEWYNAMKCAACLKMCRSRKDADFLSDASQSVNSL